MTATPSTPPQRICIVGDGFAAAVGALRLLATVTGGVQITVVGPAAQIGRGIAYSTAQQDHLVNGLAKGFGVVPEQPEHFTQWIQARAGEHGWAPPPGVAPADAFVPRALYGSYLQETLAEALHRAAGRAVLRHVRQRATDVERLDGGTYSVTLDNGQVIAADVVVLATGLYRKPAMPGLGSGVSPDRVLRDIWNPEAWRGLADAGHLLVVGSGLTALDAMLSAEAAGFRGRYTLVSRRGQLVQQRADVPPWPAGLDPQNLPTTLRQLQQAARRIRREIQEQGGHPQQIATTIRPHLPALWRTASLRDKQRFMRHLRPFWETMLHRAAPESGKRLAALQRAQRVELKVGSLQALRQTPDGRLEVSWRARGQAASPAFEVDAVVDAHGYEFDWTKLDDPLVRRLLSRGLVRPHETRFGIDAQADTGQLIDARGEAQPTLLAIGHALRGVNWESNSIGEQLAGACSVAQSLAQSVAHHRAASAELPAEAAVT